MRFQNVRIPVNETLRSAAGRLTPALAALLVLAPAGWSFAKPAAPAQSSGAAAAAAVDPSGDTVGVPWSGQKGITETTAQIMAREAAAVPLSAQPKVVREAEPEGEEEAEFERRRPMPRENPFAPYLPAQPVKEFRPFADNQLLAPQTVGVAFQTEALFTDSFFIPPDTIGDVGPTQILTATNGRIKVHDKTGALGSLNSDLDIFFNTVRDGLGTTDPHVRYDRLAGRWFVLCVNVTATGVANKVLIAVSDTSTITVSTVWTFYFFKFDTVGGTPNSDTNGFLDYPTFGVDKFALYIGGNIVNSTFTAYVGTTGFVVRKSSVLTGGPIVVTAFRGLAVGTGAGPWSPQGVSNDDPSATEGYFIGVDNAAFSLLQIRRVTDPGGTPVLSGNLGVAVPATFFPVTQFQKGSSSTAWRLDPTDDRVFAAGIHKNKVTGTSNLWTAHAIGVTSAGAASASADRNATRFYEIGTLTTTPTLVQAGGIFGGSGAANAVAGFVFPSVAVSGQGHMAQGFTLGQFATDASTSGFYPSIGLNGRLRTDASGTINTNVAIIAGTNRYSQLQGTRNRWGDFSQTWVDPTDDMTLWTFQEYCPARNVWGTAAVQLKAPPPATPASTAPNVVCAGNAAAVVTLTGTSVTGSEFFDPGPDTGGPGYPNHISVSVTGGVTVNSVTFVPGTISTPSTQLTLSLNTTGASAGAQNVTVTNPDGQSQTGVGILTIIANGGACNDGNLCTTSDVCTAGACGGTPVSCTPLDQCHDSGTCDTGTGLCSNPSKPDNTPCNDGNLCTQSDTCQTGSCTGANPVSCSPLDQCHVAGTCDTGTGLCSNPAAPDNTPCNDTNNCTANDVCTAGACGGTPLVVPGEVTNLAVLVDKQTLTWDSAAPAGPGTVHDVPRGLCDELPVGTGASEFCVAPGGIAAATTTDNTLPPIGKSYWYLVRGRNQCGTGSYGNRSNGSPRVTGICP